MNDNKAIVQSAPSLGIAPNAFFKKELFDNVIWAHGYDVIIERALKCPCKSQKADNLSSCRNCGGSGWVFLNKVKTKAVLKSMNMNTQFKDWTEVNMGNVSISVRDVDRIGFMDRITVLCSESIHTQTVFPKQYKNIVFSFLDYPPIEVEDCFMFYKSDEKLVLLKEGDDFTITENKIILDKKFNDVEDISISMRYTHPSQFHVIDLPRDIMVASVRTQQGQNVKAQMPISAIGRRAHYILDAQNFNNNLILDNSYDKPKKCGHTNNCQCQ